jgi:hypothetical protein
MLEMIRVAGIALLLVALPAAADEVSFVAGVVPLLNARCVACHLTGQEQGELALHAKAAYGNLVRVPSRQSALNRVEPGEPEASYLFLKLTNRHLGAGGEGEPMPMGAWPLEDAQLELIRQWISQGAKGT